MDDGQDEENEELDLAGAAPAKGRHECRGCGYRSETRWDGDPCPSCARFYNIVAHKVEDSSRSIAKLAFKPTPRTPTGVDPLDRILGGPDDKGRFGLVRGSTTLIGGKRGGGKSTIATWAIGNLARQGYRVMYASGEESREDVASIFFRQKIFEGLDDDRIEQVSGLIKVLGNEDDVFSIVAQAEEYKPVLLVVDSAQTVQCSDVKADFGEIAQVKAVVNTLTSSGKRLKMPIFVISQVSASGDLSGGTAAQHACDCILQFNEHFDDYLMPTATQPGPGEEPLDEAKTPWRILECDSKNRRGRADGVAYFEMTPAGRLIAVQRRSLLEMGEEGGRGREGRGERPPRLKKPEGPRLVLVPEDL